MIYRPWKSASEILHLTDFELSFIAFLSISLQDVVILWTAAKFSEK